MEDITEHRFKTAMRGYDTTEVREFLGEIDRAIRVLEERVAISDARAERAEREAADIEARIDAVVAETNEARHRIIDQAKREAIEIARRAGAGDDAPLVADAAERAAIIVARAEEDAERRRAEIGRIEEAARAEADRIIARAREDAEATRAEANRVLQEARHEARAVREQAEADRASMVEEIARLERIVAAATADGLETLETANVILRSGSEVTIDLRDEVPAAVQHSVTE